MLLLLWYPISPKILTPVKHLATHVQSSPVPAACRHMIPVLGLKAQQLEVLSFLRTETSHNFVRFAE